MASYVAFHDRILDPYGSKIYDEGTIYSENIITREASRILEVFDNDSIISTDALEIISTSTINNDKSIQIHLNPGKLIQDYVLVDVHQDIYLDLPIYSDHDIVSVDTENNFFEIDGNYVEFFPQGATFAVQNSTGNDKLDYTVDESSYNPGGNERTRIYTTTIPDSNADGKIICRRYIDNYLKYGRIAVITEFDYQKTPNVNVNEFRVKLDYVDRNDETSENLDSSVNRIILGIVEFERNGTEGLADDTAINPETVKEINKAEPITLDGIDYEVYKENALLKEPVDGGIV